MEPTGRLDHKQVSIIRAPARRVKSYTPSSFEREWTETVGAGDEDACRFMLDNTGRVKTWLSALEVGAPQQPPTCAPLQTQHCNALLHAMAQTLLQLPTSAPLQTNNMLQCSFP